MDPVGEYVNGRSYKYLLQSHLLLLIPASSRYSSAGNRTKASFVRPSLLPSSLSRFLVSWLLYLTSFYCLHPLFMRFSKISALLCAVGVLAAPSTHEARDLAVSPDGKCGGASGQTCLNSYLGDCCSKAGTCGEGAFFCGLGCQKEFGACIPTYKGKLVSQNGLCGHDVTCKGSKFGDCCGSDNWWYVKHPETHQDIVTDAQQWKLQRFLRYWLPGREWILRLRMALGLQEIFGF